MPTCIPDAHGHGPGTHAHAAHGPEGELSVHEAPTNEKDGNVEDLELQADLLDTAAAQIIGVGILEFGVLLHRWVINDRTICPSVANLGPQHSHRTYPRSQS
jgi:hypothetical protein